MRRYKPDTRYKISDNQLVLLLLIMKYRFVSTDILADSLGRDRSTIYERLSVLAEQGFITKLYDKTYRLRQRPVIYYLAPVGIRYLHKAGYEKTHLHYKNKNFTDEQIDEQFLLGKLARAIKRPYDEKFALYTKYQFGVATFYLTPQSYAKLVGETDSIPDYFIEYFPPFYESWKIRKRIDQHVEYSEENSEYTYPHLLIVCGNQSTEKRTARMVESLYTEFAIFTTTKERLLGGDKSIWLAPYGVDWDQELELHSLSLDLKEP